MSGLDSLDWSSIKFETQNMEAQLAEWFMNGDVKYIREWAFAFAERKAEYLGIPLNSPIYFQLQAMTRSKVIKSIYMDFKEKISKDPQALVGLEYRRVKYKDIDRLVEEDIERITRPTKSPVSKSSEQAFFDEIKGYSNAIECTLSEYVSKDEIELLRNASFNYAEDKAQKLKLVRGSFPYKRLHLAARYELLCEAEESLIGFCCESMDFSTRLIQDLAEHNDLDYALKEYESLTFKS